MSNKNIILVIDDEIQIRKVLCITLEASDFKVVEAGNAKDGIVHAATDRPQLIILDLGLPDRDGLSVIREIRTWSNIPIIVLSVRNAEEDIVTALDSGADDYLTKPFNTSELLARIRANIRRVQQPDQNNIFGNGNLQIDFSSRIVTFNKEEVKLTNTEYLLLAFFAKNIGKVLTHSIILKEVWGPGSTENSQYLRVFIGQLRKKIEDNPSRPEMIITESGVGYRMVQIK
jgi:two-component system, OmpR family, KDP operon response regulator KdpE